MLRLAGFFFATFFLLKILRGLFAGVPVLGWILGIPLIGFWVVAIGLSLALSKLADNALDRRKRSLMVRKFGAVETPHNMGKLGSLFAAQGRHRQALPYLERAVAGEPEVAEWHYRLGRALFGLQRHEDALASLLRALAIDEQYAYGEARMMVARSLIALGQQEDALAALVLLERFHGPSPESAYRRGVLLAALGRKDEGRVALAEVAELARTSARYQKRSGAGWAWRAWLARARG